MKQATNPFAPVPLWRKRLPGYAAMGAATVAMAIGLIAMQNARTTVAGTLLPVSEADAAAYGISAVYQLDDGSYRVEGSQKGFQSDVQAAVTLDAEGNVSAVEILSQAETDSLGGQCVDPEFTSQYQGAAPFTLAGKNYTVTDPLTGAAYAAAGAAEEQPAAAEDLDPAQWNVSDTSPEAEATRRMYAAGLTLSALNGEPLADELIPPMDTSAEAVARRKLYAAGLSKSAQDGEEQALPYADWSAEKQAAYRLAQAELTTGQTSAGAVSADLTEVDALSGATITSTAAGSRTPPPCTTAGRFASSGKYSSANSLHAARLWAGDASPAPASRLRELRPCTASRQARLFSLRALRASAGFAAFWGLPPLDLLPVSAAAASQSCSSGVYSPGAGRARGVPALTSRAMKCPSPP